MTVNSAKDIGKAMGGGNLVGKEAISMLENIRKTKNTAKESTSGPTDAPTMGNSC